MSGGGLRRLEMIEPSRFFIKHQTTTIFKPTPIVVLGEEALGFPTPSPLLDLLLLHHPNLIPTPASFHLSSTPPPFEFFDSITDLIQIEKENSSSSSYILRQRSSAITGTDLYLKSLSDRVSALELGLDRFVNAKLKDLDRNYSWTAEIKSPHKDGIDRKYKWTAEIKAAAAGKKKMNEDEEEKNYKWTAEYKGKGKNAPISNTYTFKASTAPPSPKMKTKKKKGETAATATRVIQIKEPANDQGALFLKQAFAKRAGAANNGKGKKKELSPQDAAMMIQMSFRAYLIRRSQALRALRELAVAKAKLKELRGLFNNFSYRRRIARDAEEHQKFSEKIIVLLLTVDAIEGADLMVRAARRSMIDELEAMLDVVDPQPAGKLGSMKRRTFDLPNGGIQREIAAGVAEVVQMLDQEENAGTNTFEVCL